MFLRLNAKDAKRKYTFYFYKIFRKGHKEKNLSVFLRVFITSRSLRLNKIVHIVF